MDLVETLGSDDEDTDDAPNTANRELRELACLMRWLLFAPARLFAWSLGKSCKLLLLTIKYTAILLWVQWLLVRTGQTVCGTIGSRIAGSVGSRGFKGAV
jgi:hypothetical protein